MSIKIFNHLIFVLGLILFPQVHFSQNLNPVLPAPKGDYAVGTLTWELTDTSRADLYTPGEKRKVPLKIFYPALQNGHPQESYLKDSLLLSSMMAQGYNQQDSLALTKMASFLVHSQENAVLVKNKSFPLVIFSHGLGVSKENYKMFAESLASVGYIIVLIDHPYGGFTRLSNGRILSSRQDTLLYSENRDSVLLERMVNWSKDVRLVIDSLLDKETELGQKFAAHIDQKKMATIGHSLGGNVAIQYPQEDSRIVAAINLDGGTFGNLLKAPCVPILILRSHPVYSDEELKRKGRSVVEWETMGEEIDQVFKNALQGSSESYELKIKGAGHMSFSDAPFVLPDMITRFGGKIIDPLEGFDLIFEAVNIFLGAAFEEKNPAFESLVADCSVCELRIYKKGSIIKVP